MPKSAPSERAFSSLASSPAVVITRQWKSLAIWMAAIPTPELAPSTSTVCPGRTPARVTSMCHAVTKTSGTLAAWLKSSVSGMGITFAALVLQAGDTLLAMPAEIHGCKQHTLPGLESAGLEFANVLTQFDDLSGDITAENVRQLHPWQTLPHPHIEMIQRASAHPHQHLIFSRLRIGHVLVSENFRPTELMNANGFHSDNSFGRQRLEPSTWQKGSQAIARRPNSLIT